MILGTRDSATLSVPLAFAFSWAGALGFVADRIRGLRTVLAGSAYQIVTITGFLLTQDPLRDMSMASRTRFGTNQFGDGRIWHLRV